MTLILVWATPRLKGSELMKLWGTLQSARDQTEVSLMQGKLCTLCNIAPAPKGTLFK